MSNLNSTWQVDMTSPHGNTDGRTGRTNEEPTCDTASVQSATCAGGAEPNDITDALLAIIDAYETPTQRHPVVRTGQREEIPWATRRAVYRRDGWRCHYCGSTWTEGQLELDHATPWSAGGSDKSHNLRTLCQRCNGERSNWDDGYRHKRVLPVTWWCIDCHGPDSGYRHRPDRIGAWPPRIENREGLTFAYCATCDGNSYTEVVL